MELLFLTFLLAFTSCQSDTIGCPSKEDIKPCTCKQGFDSKPWISCDGISSETELENAVEGMEGYKIALFFLLNSNIGVLPATIFSEVEIQDMSILFTNLTRMSESYNRPPFIGLENSLETLEIKDAFVNEDAPLVRLSVSHLKKLMLLQLEGNAIPILGNDWFESGPYGLRELHLLDTSTVTVGSHAFHALTQLRKISLTGGSVSIISRDMFPTPALHLEAFDFSNNQIQTLPSDLFSKMPSLTEIYLENNDLTSIDEVVFSQVWSKLSYAFFFGNPLKCDKEMKWIFKYRLPESLHGNCATPPELKFRKLTSLSLADFEKS